MNPALCFTTSQKYFVTSKIENTHFLSFHKSNTVSRSQHCLIITSFSTFRNPLTTYLCKQRGRTVNVAGTWQPSCSPVQGSSDTTSPHIPYPKQWLPLAPRATRLRLYWSKPPLVGQFVTSALTSVYQAPILMPVFQQLSLILSHGLQNKRISSHARYIKITMQCETQTRLTPLNPPRCFPPHGSLLALTRLSLVANYATLLP